MKLGNAHPARESGIRRQKQSVNHLAVLIRDTANALGIEAIEIEASKLLKNTFRVQFGDCTGRKQTLFLPRTVGPARVSQMLRLVSGSRPISKRDNR